MRSSLKSPAPLTFAVLLLAAPAALLSAAPRRRPPAAPEAARAAPVAAPAHLRVWKAECPGQPELAVHLGPITAGGDKEAAGKGQAEKKATGALAAELARFGSGYQFQGYGDVPAGPRALLVFAGSTRGGEPLVRGPLVPLVPDGFYTVLLRPDPGAPGGVRVECLDDTPTPAAAGTAALSVYNLAPAVRDLRVSLGETLRARFHGAGGQLKMVGIPPVPAGLHLDGTLDGGRKFEAAAEANFRASPRQTLLVFPDAYGRIRTQVVEDGPAATAAPAAATTPMPGS